VLPRPVHGDRVGVRGASVSVDAVVDPRHRLGVVALAAAGARPLGACRARSWRASADRTHSFRSMRTPSAGPSSPSRRPASTRSIRPDAFIQTRLPGISKLTSTFSPTRAALTAASCIPEYDTSSVRSPSSRPFLERPSDARGTERVATMLARQVGSHPRIVPGRAGARPETADYAFLGCSDREQRERRHQHGEQHAERRHHAERAQRRMLAQRQEAEREHRGHARRRQPHEREAGRVLFVAHLEQEHRVVLGQSREPACMR